MKIAIWMKLKYSKPTKIYVFTEENNYFLNKSLKLLFLKIKFQIETLFIIHVLKLIIVFWTIRQEIINFYSKIELSCL